MDSRYAIAVLYIEIRDLKQKGIKTGLALAVLAASSIKGNKRPETERD